MTARLRPLAVLAVVAASLALPGCTHHGFELPFEPAADPAPLADSPRHALQLFNWCWDNRDYDHYRTLFTADYRFEFMADDSAGNAYRDVPWTRDDELISARN